MGERPIQGGSDFVWIVELFMAHGTHRIAGIFGSHEKAMAWREQHPDYNALFVPFVVDEPDWAIPKFNNRVWTIRQPP